MMKEMLRISWTAILNFGNLEFSRTAHLLSRTVHLCKPYGQVLLKLAGRPIMLAGRLSLVVRMKIWVAGIFWQSEYIPEYHHFLADRLIILFPFIPYIKPHTPPPKNNTRQYSPEP